MNKKKGDSLFKKEGKQKKKKKKLKISCLILHNSEAGCQQFCQVSKTLLPSFMTQIINRKPVSLIIIKRISS